MRELRMVHSADLDDRTQAGHPAVDGRAFGKISEDTYQNVLGGVHALLQRLKGQGLVLRWFGFEAESGLGEESVDEGGPVLDALEPVLDDRGQLVGGAAGSQVAQAVFHVRPGALDRVEVRGVGGQLDDGQPVRVRAGEGAHHGAEVGVQVVPAQDDRGIKLMCARR